MEETDTLMKYISYNKDGVYQDAEETATCGDGGDTIAFSIPCEFDIISVCKAYGV
jgi:hypothetical protein